MRKMSRKDRKRLELLFRMIGSSNAGEAENARRLILEMLARYRKNWNDLTDLMKDEAVADTWREAYGDNRSTDQHAGDAVDAGLPEAAVKRTAERSRTSSLHPARIYRHEAARARRGGVLDTAQPRLRALHHLAALAFTSPVNGCGKTTALAVIEKLAYRPERMDNATPAVIYHLIDRLHGGTLLVDEADNIGLTVNGILRSVLNSGHRKGGNIRRVIKGAPKKFSTFAPMAIACHRQLPLPLMRRSIIIHMEKAAGGGNHQAVRHRQPRDNAAHRHRLWLHPPLGERQA